MGTWTLGADNATVHNVPEPGAGPIQPRRPIPQLSRINSIRFDGKSIYHGVTFKAERRLANNFAYNVSYTLSDSKDDASSPGPTEAETNFPQNVRNIFDETGEWALSSFNHTHQFIASGVYQLPFFSGAGGVAEAVLGGWRANAIFVAQSGAPFTVNLSVDRANIGAGPAQRPDQLRDPNLSGSEQTPERWFDTSAFALQAPFTFGNAPRNSVIGPGFANVDFALAKTWRLGGTSELEFRWEIFNLLNRANFNLPNRIFGNSELRSDFERQEPARDAVRGALGVLSWWLDWRVPLHDDKARGKAGRGLVILPGAARTSLLRRGHRRALPLVLEHGLLVARIPVFQVAVLAGPVQPASASNSASAFLAFTMSMTLSASSRSSSACLFHSARSPSIFAWICSGESSGAFGPPLLFLSPGGATGRVILSRLDPSASVTAPIRTFAQSSSVVGFVSTTPFAARCRCHRVEDVVGDGIDDVLHQLFDRHDRRQRGLSRGRSRRGS